MGDWVYDNAGKIVLGLIAFMLWFSYMSVSYTLEAKKAFMTECVQDHKEYECKAMWRAGDPNYVYIHTR